MEMLSSDAIFEIAMRIEEPVDLINFYSVNKRILNLFNEYKLWKKHAKKFLNIDIPNSRKKCVEYAAKNREINDFLLNQYDDLKKLNSMNSLLELIEATTAELWRETIRVQNVLIYERDYVDWKLLEVMDKNRDFIIESTGKINLILTENNTNEIDKKYMLYQVLLVINDKLAEVYDIF